MRLIDADKVFERADEVTFMGFRAEERKKQFMDLVSEIMKQSTVDAVPVVHGRWEIITDDYDCEMMCCSVCRSEFYDGDNDTVDCLHNYCPNCGADMRERGERE